MNILYDAAALSVTAATGFTGTAALTVPQPTIAASGTITAPPITGTAALNVTQPAIAGSGTVSVAPITGTAALSVTQPSIAASGTVSVAPITGTAALTVAQPQINASGTIPVTTPPAGGGRPHRKAVVHRYPERRPTPFDPADLTVSTLHEWSVALEVSPPRIRAHGFVTSRAANAADDRLALDLMMDDEDLALALTLADTWTN